MTDATTPDDLFAALRGLLRNAAGSLQVVHDSPDHFYANGPHPDARGKPQFFCAVKVSGRKHAFHFMPVYEFPELLADISPALKKRMQGKSCFNFDRWDPELIDELAQLVVQGTARYRSLGRL
ncbi:hypothetical protein IAE57_14375 [Stenotrophomonas sp. S48]|uniref:hypothetical protein n=1 Tax=unclassified Stenotrophomonas TaxID=196198 RepID=UPI0019022423|nr:MULTISPECIES: hypothetical protein [unclassified Stenotrophomonas]MBK0027354.1 hypothetical protein [Stenotrophomonas sp. S48]MBK0049734.1 hypothetical protein [Stenotrophomonas sp. S49]